MLVQNVQTDPRSLSGIFSVFKGKNAIQGDAFSKMFDRLNANSGQTDKFVSFKNESNDQTAFNDQTDTKICGNVSDKKAYARTNENGKDAGNNVSECAVKDKAPAGSKKADGITEEDIEKVSLCFTQITVVVSQFFAIDEEQLQDFLTAAGMDATDLGNLQKLKELFVNVNCDGDVAALLSDDELLMKCNMLTDTVSGIITDFGFEAEDFSEALRMAAASEGKEEVVSATVKDLLPKEENKNTKIGENDRNVTDKETVGEDVKAEFIEKSENSGSKDRGNGNSNRRSSSDGEIPDLTNRFVDHMIGNLRNENTDFSALIDQPISFKNITDQILTQIRVNVVEDISSLEIRLSPEHLGKVSVVVEDNNGVMTAKFQTESRIAKEAIESSLPVFKQQLREQGFKVDTVSVSVAEYAFDKNRESGNGSGNEEKNRNRRHFSLEEINEKVDGVSSDLSEKIYFDNGTSTVSYSA